MCKGGNIIATMLLLSVIVDDFRCLYSLLSADCLLHFFFTRYIVTCMCYICCNFCFSVEQEIFDLSKTNKGHIECKPKHGDVTYTGAEDLFILTAVSESSSHFFCSASFEKLALGV